MREFERRPFLSKRYDYYKYYDCAADFDYCGVNYNHDYCGVNYNHDYCGVNYNYDYDCCANFNNHNYNCISDSLLFDGLFVKSILQRILV